MNIIYKLSFIDKQTNPKYYIGCKSECSLIDIDGIPTIISLKDNRPYYGSASSKLFQEDFLKYKIKAEIVKEVSNRDELIKEEHILLTSLNCAASEEYYNLSNGVPRQASYVPVNFNKIINTFGETVKEYNSSKTVVAKRDNTSIKCGFNNFAELAFKIYNLKLQGKTGKDISDSFNKDRHFATKFISLWDMQKALEDIKRDDLSEKVKDMYAKGASLHFISTDLGIELPAARYFLSDFTGDKQTIAGKLNKTPEELTQNILEKIGKEKKTITEVAQVYGMTTQAVYRYIERYIQSLY